MLNTESLALSNMFFFPINLSPLFTAWSQGQFCAWLLLAALVGSSSFCLSVCLFPTSHRHLVALTGDLKLDWPVTVTSTSNEIILDQRICFILLLFACKSAFCVCLKCSHFSLWGFSIYSIFLFINYFYLIQWFYVFYILINILEIISNSNFLLLSEFYISYYSVCCVLFKIIFYRDIIRIRNLL